MEAKPEDLDAVLERWVPAYPADVGTAHMEAPSTGRYSRDCAGFRVTRRRISWRSSPACF
jgi:hypothetical protein